MKTTYEITNELIEKGNKKEMFNMIYLNPENLVSSTLFDFEKEVSSTFCSDIASRACESFLQDREIRISEKQAWCLVFDIVKNASKFNAWMINEINEIN
jgi:hypothetical protein